MLTERDRYTVGVIRQDFLNQIGTPPADPVQMLLDYLLERALRRARYRITAPDYCNTNAEVERLIALLV